MDAVEWLRALIRVPSVNPSPDGEAEVAELLRAPLDAAGVSTRILISPAGRPSLVARLTGAGDGPPLVLLSHTDVVPADPDRWRQDPFGAEPVDGEVWGRGALDMKSVAVMHATALLSLAAAGRPPSRDVLLVAVADEEAGGGQGARWLIDQHGGRVGFRQGVAPDVLGEGGFGLTGILPRPVLPIVLGEKAPLRFRAHASGPTGHGSLPPERQAIRDLGHFIEAVAGGGRPRIHPVMREQFAAFAEVADGMQRHVFRLLAGPLGAVAARAVAPMLRARSGVLGHLLTDTITVTELEAGTADNVVPGTAHAGFDGRLLPDQDPERVFTDLRRVARRHGIRLEELDRWYGSTSPRTSLYDVLTAVSSTLPDDPVVVPSLTPGTTDLRHFRAAGAATYGWIPLVLTPALLAGVHGDDERVPVDDFRVAVDAMCSLVMLAAGPDGSAAR